jgi:hypothetical protein
MHISGAVYGTHTAQSNHILDEIAVDQDRISLELLFPYRAGFNMIRSSSCFQNNLLLRVSD